MKQGDTNTEQDHELLLLSIQDPAIFSRIVDRYQGPFMRKAVSLIGNEQDAQDIVQDAFVKIYLNAPKFEVREGAAFSSWAYKILSNTCFSYHKKHRRHMTLLSYDEVERAVADEEVEDTRLDNFLLTLSRIPEGCARLLRRLVVEGKSYTELAEEEGVELGTLRVRIHRAKARFKEALIQYPNL